jgi:hypothetical protein
VQRADGDQFIIQDGGRDAAAQHHGGDAPVVLL